ncbi:MAG: hypothetical protein ABEK12_02840, partial [Candidatus Nanohaloarchaea archaeon]
KHEDGGEECKEDVDLLDALEHEDRSVPDRSNSDEDAEEVDEACTLDDLPDGVPDRGALGMADTEL